MSDGLRRNTMLGSSSSNNSGGGGTSTSGSYTVNLNGQWELATTPANPDSALYDGVYRSASNYNVNSGVSIMYITIKDCSSFQIYIRSYAESSYDYVMISQLDQTINGSTSYSNTTLVKAHTRGNQQSGTALSNYTLVEYTGITSGEHTITVVYRKDGSSHSGDDRGYVLILKSQEGFEEESGPIDINNYLTIEALEDGLTAKLSTNACEYCIDGDGVWNTLEANTTTPSISQGQVISFRGNLTPSSSNGIGTFTISKKCNLKGNCMSMLFGNNAENNYSLNGKNCAFYELFYNCTNIIEVSSNFLPATALASYCYKNMFYGCSSLTTSPELPATTLERDCYYCMFVSCTSLTKAPSLPATTLAEYCYKSMFASCKSLTTPPKLRATTLQKYCCDNMFFNCTSLTTAPDLPAITLVNYCYDHMFNTCSKLNYIKAMFTTAPRSSYTGYWVSTVSSTGIFVKNAEATWDVTGSHGIPKGWTVIEEPPVEGYLTFSVEGHKYPFPVNNITITTWEEFISGEEGSVEFSILEDGSIYSNIMHNKVVYEGTSIFVNKYHTLINGYTYAIYQDTNPA